MDSQFYRKKNHNPRIQKNPTSSSSSSLLCKWANLLFLSSFFFFFTFFLFGRFPNGSQAFRPVLTISRLSQLSIHGSSTSASLPPLQIEERVSFPDHVLLLVSKIDPSLLHSYRVGLLECVYRIEENNSLNSTSLAVLPVLSVDEFDESRSIARCPLSPANRSTVITLRTVGRREEEEENGLLLMANRSDYSWESLVYGGAIDGDTAVVFVKGLNLRPDRASDPSQFLCHFGWSTRYFLTTPVHSAAQEVIRCELPRSFKRFPDKANGVRVTLSLAHHRNSEGLQYFPSVAKLSNLNNGDIERRKRHELCVCTMVWNQASALREWVQYHAWLGVERWFIYDNNSDDGIEEVVDELEQESYNVSRHTWPWIKTQEAGFSHCALRAKGECKWVGFLDVDEFFYFPVSSRRKMGGFEGYPGRNSLRSLVANSATIGEIRTACHSFGPSGLSKAPSQGVTLGYTCRLQSPERHKSIVQLDALDETLLNVVHHFHLKRGYRYVNLPQSTALINHYKYQVWETFRAKFFRRVATYVADWQENQNEGSKDRAPGLGTEVIEPPNWSRRFCEVWDTGLRDFVIANLADPASGLLPWEREVSSSATKF